MTALPAYVPAPAIGSLVALPADAPFCYCCRRNAGYVGIVQAVQRDIRSGRVLTVTCHWYDTNWTRLANDVHPVGHLAPWSPPVR